MSFTYNSNNFINLQWGRVKRCCWKYQSCLWNIKTRSFLYVKFNEAWKI